MVSTNDFSRRVCVLIGAILLGSASSEAAPSDIVILESMTEKALESRSVSEVKTELQAVAMERTEAIAESRGYPATLRSSNPLVRKYVMEEIAKTLTSPSFYSKVDSQRAMDLALKILSGTLSEDAFAHAAFQPAPKPPEKWQQARPLSSSATVTSQRLLSMDLSKSRVENDRGMIGSNNGILDPGETAQLRLAFTNSSSRRLMSTSVYIRSVSECLFVSTPSIGSELQLEELEPEQSAVIALNVYASSECSGQSATISFDAYDTHEFSTKPLKYALSLALSDATEATLVNVRIDRDDYGHSEPQSAQQILPKDQVEISASLALKNPGYSFAEQTVLGPVGAESATHRSGRVEFRASEGRYVARMNDDLDLTFPSKNDLLERLRPVAAAYGWNAMTDARVYVAIDTQFGVKESTPSVTNNTDEPVYTFDSTALRRHLADHLHIEVNRSSAPPSEGRLAVGSVDGFRFEIDDPGPLMAKLQDIDLRVVEPTTPDPSSYAVRHYIELPIFWERIMNPTCEMSVPSTAQTGQQVPVSVSFTDVPKGSRVLVNGMGIGHSSRPTRESGVIVMGTATMPSRSTELSLQIIDSDGSVICRKTHRVTNTTPVAKPTPPPAPTPMASPTSARLPLAMLAGNAHLGGLGGFNFTGTIGRSFGLVASTGSIGGIQVTTIGAKATQMLASDGEGMQFSLTESLEYGDRLGYSYTRGSIYLSAYRVFGLNIGMHVENNEFGGVEPSFGLGLGGFFGAAY
ncbi:MAG: hypothetical protein VX127_15625 [Myxococcota bacterium]|nr:hypothetical protein [Myxococcota bacterium]